MKKRLLIVLALLGALLPVGGMFQSVSAGTGSATSCNDGAHWGHIEVVLLTTPITLALEVPWGTANPDMHARLCYSTSPAGYGDGDGENDIAGGSIQVAMVNYPYPGDPYAGNDRVQVSCAPQSNPSFPPLQRSCYGGTTPVYGFHTGQTFMVNQEDNYTLFFSVPITFCAPSCTTIAPGLGTTGVILGAVDLNEISNVLNDGSAVDGTNVVTGGPSGTTGAGIRSGVLLWYCVNGSCQPLSSPLNLGAGVATGPDPTSWRTGTGSGSDAGPAGTDNGGTVTLGTGSTTGCVNTTCQTVPSVVAPTVGAGVNLPGGTWGCIDLVLFCQQGVQYPAGVPIAAIQIGSTVIPVGVPICVDEVPPRTDGSC